MFGDDKHEIDQTIGCNEDECIPTICGCVGYVCELENGEYRNGVSCMKNVLINCGLSKSLESKLKSTQKNKIIRYKNLQYHIYPCRGEIGNYEIVEEEKEEEDYIDLTVNKRFYGDFEHFVNEKEDVEVELKKVDATFYSAKTMIERIQKSLSNVKIAADELVKTTEDGKNLMEDILIIFSRKNPKSKHEEYFSNKRNEFAGQNEDVKEISRNIKQKLDILDGAIKSIEFKYACGIVYDEFKKYTTEAEKLAEEYFKEANEFLKPINKIKKQSNELFHAAINKLADEVAECQKTRPVKKVGKKSKESKSIGKSSNETANFGFKTGMEVKDELMDAEQLDIDYIEELQKIIKKW
uniref:Uncharacterized protein n=1 Tax=Panagrolaimus davidi TaxID=227884 RepID=A0A914QMJ2_9BILA